MKSISIVICLIFIQMTANAGVISGLKEFFSEADAESPCYKRQLFPTVFNTQGSELVQDLMG